MKFLTHPLVIIFFLPPLSALAANQWIGAGAAPLWDDVDNWSEGFAPPDATTHPNFGWDDPAGTFYPLTSDTSDDFPRFSNEAHLPGRGTVTLIDDTILNAAAFGLYVGFDGASNELRMTGGKLTVGEWHLNIGRGFNRHGNPDPHALMVMTGGTIDTQLVKIPEQFVDPDQSDPYDTAPIRGELIMTGGEINARKINVGQFVGDGHATFAGDAVVNLVPNVPGDPNNGGHLELKQDWFVDGLPVPTVSDASVDISEGAVINIFGNRNPTRSVPDQDELDRYLSYVDNGWLTAWGGIAEPVITLHEDMITIRAPTVLGDYSGNGSVDAADYTVWRDLLGTTTSLAGKLESASTPGLVDHEDYRFWKSAFGSRNVHQTRLAQEPLPEPGSIVLLICAIAGLDAVKAKRRGLLHRQLATYSLRQAERMITKELS